MEVLLAADPGGTRLTVLPDAAAPGPAVTGPVVLDAEHLPPAVRTLERERPRWVWADTAATYPALLRAGVRLERCHDLRLCHAVLRSAGVLPAVPGSPWDAAAGPAPESGAATLFDDVAATVGTEEVRAEHRRQQLALAGADGGRLRLLLAAESAGALVAAEMTHDGLPFDPERHDEMLTALLGPRPGPGARPAALESLAGRVRDLLGAPALNPDSPADLRHALRGAGLEVRTTRRHELAALDHPAVGPLLEYKKRARLLAANGWTWMEAWVAPADAPGRRGRFRPGYVPGGVVTGRWAARGGGALQLPHQVRGSVVADPGWRLVVADAAQLEPRVLAAMSRDEAMARASRAGDLYQALVDEGVAETRAGAKVAMLGALYGATTGEAGLLMPRLQRTYPRAVRVVEEAARAGERGGVVRTWLGRTSPAPPPQWHRVQRRASEGDADETDRRRAGAVAREWGRFTRNFVVQGSAAEWALAWLADLRLRLRRIDGGAPHLVFFLHDEVVVHSPADAADEVAAAVRAAAAAAGRLLFGDFPVDFALDVAVVESYDEAV